MAALRTERDALEARCLAAEAQAERMAGELSAARAELARAAATDESRSIFDEADPGSRSTLAPDGSDPTILPVALAATAVVAAMVTLLAALNGTLRSPFGLVTLGLTVVLAWFAWLTRVVRTEVSITRGMVYIDRGGSSYRFDLRSEATRVEVAGRPGDPDWRVRFLRRSMDPFTVDRTMVDPHEFSRQLRTWRPDL